MRGGDPRALAQLITAVEEADIDLDLIHVIEHGATLSFAD